ncbi:hypothetical protein [Bacillus sp. Marseille-P3661]|uniref:hypothetical protein n=1 Tax=Bacillus sp. Marseille-P3661 TaxID=1936234 RepID=UPI0015E15E2E|nr:hypothetical protein [Bacillus sp. Marseille-P3661]
MNTNNAKPIYYDGSGSQHIKALAENANKQFLSKPTTNGSLVVYPYFPYFNQNKQH